MTRAVPTALVPLALLATGCMSHMQLQVLEPALVTSPSEIRNLAVVDRSRARNVGQGILGTIEAAVTGEAIGADNMGRSRAMTAVVMGLRNSPRFDAAETFLPRKELESSLFDKELSWRTASRICREAGCQGIIALEAFDSDSTTDVRTRVEKDTDDDGNEVSRTVFEAQRDTRVTTAWRYYDVVNRQIIDDVRTFDSAHSWTERGDSRSLAMNRLPPQGDAVAFVGDLVGASYARRIAPTYVMVSRSYYGRGHEDLKLARNHVRALDWPGAVDLWDRLYSESPEPKVRGKAAYNMALAAEVEGDLRNAASWATEAAILLANNRARSYRRLLERRLADQLRLEEQMRMSAPGAVAGEEPLAVPGRAPKRPSPRRVNPDNPPPPPSGNRTPSSPSDDGGNRTAPGNRTSPGNR